MILVSVIVPAHNPDPDRLARVLAALAGQSLADGAWELILVDNASSPPVGVDLAAFAGRRVPARIVIEPQLGLTAARARGFAESRAPLVAMIDDDNIVAPDFLEAAIRFAGEHPQVGTFGGRVVPVYEMPPPTWFPKTGINLGCRDFGPLPEIIPALPRPTAYPAHAPVGAGMVLRREVADLYRAHVARIGPLAQSDRRGRELASGGDCEIVLVGLHGGWATAYAPSLRLDHVIPASRLAPAYLARLNHDSTRSWVQLLDRFSLNPWQPIHPLTAPIRRWRAWIRLKPWRGPAERIAWAGACGMIAGRADLWRLRTAA